MRTAIVLFTRDLRVHDNPALAAAADAAEHVLPLFVLDDEILDRFGAPNRRAFLGEALRDLAGSLGGLAVRRGETVAEVVRLAREADAGAVFVAEDAGAFAKRRERRLCEQLEVRVFPSHSVVAIDDVRTTAGTGYRIFTPYWRAWRQATRRAVLPAPRIALPPGVELGRLADLGPGDSPERTPGGERAARARLATFVDESLAGYAERADDLAADATSRLSPYLHLGCISPRELEERTRSCEAFVRQLCWRDFFLQLLAANPGSVHDDLRPRAVAWRRDPDALEAWKDGRTGYPIVDAAMRQLRAEGWLPNRARLIVGSFLTKTLRIDWREGAQHFFDLLVDGDLASNTGNWQWIGGTGADTRPNRVLNPLRQAVRHDPHGDYVRRHLPELSAVPGRSVHTPWTLDSPVDYPAPIIEGLSRA
ncbi:MAG TPA: deoxyribodipyrimidine photo-lyase [Gaiellaceae bacterium]|nr:deoxyribodipyrimidine photo-lyase [Gaiellaceae bacterium]